MEEKVEIPQHVQKFISTELNLYRSYKTLVAELKKDIADEHNRSRQFDMNGIGGGSGSFGNPIESSVIKITSIEERIRLYEWRVRKVEAGMSVLNPEQIKLVEAKFFGEYSPSNEELIILLGYSSNRNKFYLMLNQVQYQFCLQFGVMP
jgi:hypothetical protein